MSDIMKIFNSQDEIEMKQAFKEIVINQFRTEVEENDRYLFDSNEIEDMVIEAFQGAINEVKEEYKERLRKQMFAMADKDIEKLIKGKNNNKPKHCIDSEERSF